jgi:Tripartite tricarboxylate transporter TctB family
MLSRRALEFTTVVLTGAFGAAVAVSSLDNGIGWSTAGVDAGTFPLVIGLIILGGSLFNLARAAMQPWEIALSWAALGRVIGLFLPAAVFIAVIPLIGLYLASGAYIFAAMAVQNRSPALRALVMAVATPLALYLVFERMFQVSLPHGALADVLGF